MFRIDAAGHVDCHREGMSRRGFLQAAVAGASSVCLPAPLRAAPEGVPDAARPKDSPPLALHPDNPRYFLWRDKPTLLIGSGEHYGAVLNRRFDYAKYLDTLARCGLNHTRLFTGLYVEDNGQLRDGPQAGNTLDPDDGELLCPFARSDTPGYPGGGNKFDLTRWDAAYFDRLGDFVAKASERSVVVEVCLFCPYYDDRFGQWRLSPFNATNNVNGLGRCAPAEVFTLDRNDGLLAVQEAMVRRILGRLRDADNVYFEICNEPYGIVPADWERHIADVIVAAEAGFPHKHLVSQNVDGNTVENPHPAVSIFNFHYATPEAAARNYGLNKPLGDDETGFKGTTDAPYRREAWRFVLAGGALFSHLDYSFTVGHEDGSFVVPAGQWGGGGTSIRDQLRRLRDFMHEFDFVRMAPDDGAVAAGLPVGIAAAMLAERGTAYAVYLSPTGGYSVRWTASLAPQQSETCTFHTISEGGVRLWVDGKQIIDHWAAHTEAEDSGTVALIAGRTVNVTMEYGKGVGGVGSAKLHWSGPGRTREVVPADRLTAPGGGPGFKAEYFAGRDLARPMLTRTDAAVDFYWGASVPFESHEQPLELRMDLPAGAYRAEWVNPVTGGVEKEERFRHEGGVRAVTSPGYVEDIALRLKRTP